MNSALIKYKAKLAELVLFEDGRSEEDEDLLTSELDGLWYSLSPEERAIADSYSEQLASDEISPEEFFIQAYAPRVLDDTESNIEWSISGPQEWAFERNLPIIYTIIQDEAFVTSIELKDDPVQRIRVDEGSNLDSALPYWSSEQMRACA